MLTAKVWMFLQGRYEWNDFWDQKWARLCPQPMTTCVWKLKHTLGEGKSCHLEIGVCSKSVFRCQLWDKGACNPYRPYHLYCRGLNLHSSLTSFAALPTHHRTTRLHPSSRAPAEPILCSSHFLLHNRSCHARDLSLGGTNKGVWFYCPIGYVLLTMISSSSSKQKNKCFCESHLHTIINSHLSPTISNLSISAFSSMSTLKQILTQNMGVSQNSGTPKSSILIGFSTINHPFWGTPIFGNTQFYHFPTPKWLIWSQKWTLGVAAKVTVGTAKFSVWRGGKFGRFSWFRYHHPRLVEKQKPWLNGWWIVDVDWMLIYKGDWFWLNVDGVWIVLG